MMAAGLRLSVQLATNRVQRGGGCAHLGTKILPTGCASGCGKRACLVHVKLVSPIFGHGCAVEYLL
jgi:hypothetical protein